MSLIGPRPRRAPAAAKKASRRSLVIREIVPRAARKSSFRRTPTRVAFSSKEVTASRRPRAENLGVRCAVMKPKLRVWVMFGDELKFGDGRARLFELIEERGSLKKAAQELEMSYRNAWGYLRDLEEAAGFKFVERVPGGGPASGMRLTKAGKRFLERYKKFRGGLDDAAKRQFERAFGA
jgi:molybdate transport system regulatory protein